MASGFSRDRDMACEGPGCQADSGVAYYVKEQKTFCDDCATKKGRIRKVKKDELGLFCEKHDEPVRLFCKHHDLAVCHLCGVIDHTVPPCALQDVEDAVAIKKCELENLRSTSMDKVSSWKKLRERLGRCAVEATEHLQSVTESVNLVINDEISKINMKEQNEIETIDKEADTEIQRINEKRKALLDKCHEDAEILRQPIESRRRELLDDVTAIADKTRTKMADIQSDARDVLKAIEDAAERIEFFLEDDREILKGTQQLEESLTDTLRKAVDEGAIEYITRTVKGVRFIEGMGNEKYNGRIGGYEGKWEIISAVEIQGDINFPAIVGCTSDNDIIISNITGGELHTYCLNAKEKICQRVITSDGKTCIASCARLGEDTIVCGKYMIGCTGDSLTGCISVYSSSTWEVIRNITIPRNRSDGSTCVYVAVDQDGMIIAAEVGQKYIYIANPHTGDIVNTIMCEEKIARMRGVMSTRDVIAHPFPRSKRFLIIDRQRARREITHSEEILNCGIDPLTDDLYVVYWDKRRRVAVVDQLSGEGHQHRVEVLTYPLHNRQASPLANGWAGSEETYIRTSGLVMTSPDELVVCNGKKCLVVNKTFIL